MGDQQRDLRAGHTGQSLVEFALVLLPLFAILLGIIQLGFIFNAYVTVANAAREGARAGSIWVADQTASQTTNDGDRTNYVQTVVNNSLGLLTPANATTNVTYPAIDGNACRGTASDVRRKDQCVRVHVDYSLTLIIPFIADIFGSGGTMPIGAESQMVIN
jgi:Flp pilus assembly protein TadG